MDKKKTAAYCRVSTLNDSQDGSFEIQCGYYEKLIQSDPTMEFAGVYGDRGKSGRSIQGREELNRLIHDCEAGRVERILTKSIGRFARSMSECVEVIRYLSELGVSVYFERERLDTQSMSGELILGILATIAEEESNSISRNVEWTHKKHLERGQPFSPAKYGYRSVGKEHKWEIVSEEAEIVKKAFYMAGMCFKYREIAGELNRMENERGSTRVWYTHSVRAILLSEVYIGDYLSHKTCVIFDKNGRRRRIQNKGHVDQILIQGHHPALVSNELYEMIQILLQQGLLSGSRSNYYAKELETMEKAKRIAAREAERWKEEGCAAFLKIGE